ncbi:hypothetical protein RJ640_011180 [Escallonia rubra]|uniref:Uncharacterized protein n=1 Tax=Escallonia rubra TaxID=112253 RepID=A0AA88RQH4_9ASTE|nr:hypothetical protein RJ640_011180 [Escallonia rubra]
MFATAIRYVGKKPKPKMKPIELKTPPEQTQTITRAIFDIVKEHGPLTVADTWERVKLRHRLPVLSISSLTARPPSPLSPVAASYRRRTVFTAGCPYAKTLPALEKPITATWAPHLLASSPAFLYRPCRRFVKVVCHLAFSSIFLVSNFVLPIAFILEGKKKQQQKLGFFFDEKIK